MKNKIVFLISLALLVGLLTFTVAQDTPPSTPGSIGQEDAEKIKETTEKIPLDPNTGKLDQDKLDEQKSKAEKRIESINDTLKKTDKIFLFLFKIPLRISWQFTYLLFLVLLSLSIFHNIPLWAGLEKEWFNITLAFAVTLSLGFFGIFKYIIDWIILITNAWYWDMIVVVAIIIIITIVSWLAVLAHKRRLKKADQERIESAERAKQDAEFTGNLAGALTDGLSKT